MTKNANQAEFALSLSEVVAAAAHDLTTPLSSILGLSQMLLDGKAADEATRREFLSIIHLQATQLERIVQSLRDLSLVETDVTASAVLQMVAPDQLLGDLVARFRPAAADKRISIVVRVEPESPPLHTDRGRATQVLDNLLGNAIKFTGEGGTIEIRAQRAASPDFVRISIQDSGIGIAQESLPHVFDRLFRVQPPTGQGMGLGLYVARKLTASLGGTMGVESQLGKGSCFWVEFPTGHSAKDLHA